MDFFPPLANVRGMPLNKMQEKERKNFVRCLLAAAVQRLSGTNDHAPTHHTGVQQPRSRREHRSGTDTSLWCSKGCSPWQALESDKDMLNYTPFFLLSSSHTQLDLKQSPKGRAASPVRCLLPEEGADAMGWFLKNKVSSSIYYWAFCMAFKKASLISEMAPK